MFDVTQIQEMLPHRYPFLLVDRVTSLEEGKSIEAYLNISITNQVFQGHFPGHPIYPGVLIIEGMAQAGGILAFQSVPKEEVQDKVVYFMSIDKAKFRNPIIPDCELYLEIEAIKSHGVFWKYKGVAKVNGIRMANAEWAATVVDRVK